MRMLISIVETSYSLPVLRRVIGDATLYVVGVPDVESLVTAVWSAIDDLSEEYAYSTHYTPHDWESFLACVVDALHPGFGPSLVLEYVFKLWDIDETKRFDGEIQRMLQLYSTYQTQEGA